jgi:hypothetical protein
VTWQVVEKPAGQGWAEEFGAAAAGPSAGWASEFHQQQQQQQAGPMPQRDWADEFAAGVANINLNTEELTDEQLEAAWAAVGGGCGAGWFAVESAAGSTAAERQQQMPQRMHLLLSPAPAAATVEVECVMQR